MRRKSQMTGAEKRNSKSNSDKKIEKLYIEALRSAREGRKQEVFIQKELGNKATKKDKRTEKILEVAIQKHQAPHRPQRRAFSVPVSRLAPFKNEITHGLQFPRDFRKDKVSQQWVPRGDMASPCGISEHDRSFSGECSNEDCSMSETFTRPSTSTDNRDSNVEHTLNILPLRSPDDDVMITSNKIKSHLPPIYRTSVWRETVARCYGNRGSIPSRVKGWEDRGSVPMLIGKEELHMRTSARKNIMNLEERRIRLEQGNPASRRSPPKET